MINLNSFKKIINNINKTISFFFSEQAQSEQMLYDVLVVGGGVAGLSSAIKLKQLAIKHNQKIEVCLIEKGSEIGSHQLSGNCFETRALDELFPQWRYMKKENVNFNLIIFFVLLKRPPLNTPISQDIMAFLTENKLYKFPKVAMPKQLANDQGNYIISIGSLCKWLAEQANNLGVNIFNGFAGDQFIFGKSGEILGVQTKDFGISKKLTKKDNYSQGVQLLAKQTILAEGARGSLTENIIHFRNLRENCVQQTYALGLKELWELRPQCFTSGKVMHTIGWPLGVNTYGGGFFYMENPNYLHIGLVVGLDYKNPYLNPYEEFQKLKTHQEIRKMLEGGNCIQYGARILNEGGYFSIPKLTFPGGLIIGCSAGLLNTMKIKGAHTAIKSGIIAAENIFNEFAKNQYKLPQGVEITSYESQLKKSWVFDELYRSRNFHAAFKYSLFAGLINGAFINFISKGKEPWNFKHNKLDSNSYKISKSKEILYPKHDGIYTFDLLDNLIKSGTNHEHDQPSHLIIKENKSHIPLKSYQEYGGPEQLFCPAKVYEFQQDENNNIKLQINAQNCVHCKACSVKMIEEYIDWRVPEGGGGPNYSGM